MKDLQDKKQNLEKELNYIVDLTSHLKKSLSQLDENQIAAVSILLWQIQIVSQGSRVLGKQGNMIMTRFNSELDKICPDPPKVELTGDPCFDASVAYVSAVQKCENEGTEEEKCYDAHGYMGTLMDCAMAKVEDLQGILGKIGDDLGLPKSLR